MTFLNRLLIPRCQRMLWTQGTVLTITLSPVLVKLCLPKSEPCAEMCDTGTENQSTVGLEGTLQTIQFQPPSHGIAANL